MQRLNAFHRWQSLIIIAVVLGQFSVTGCFAWSPPFVSRQRWSSSSTPPVIFSASSSTSSATISEDALDLERFQRAVARAQQQQSQASLLLDPNATPQQVVTHVLQGLQRPDGWNLDRPRTHTGVVQLLQASTEAWQQTLATVVGGTAASLEQQLSVACALSRYLSRPGQQFAILMGVEDRDYTLDFPTDLVEWSDDECWLECRLRSQHTNQLLVVLGWTLRRARQNHNNQNFTIEQQQQQEQQPWLIHAMDWQDFRDPYRPGIGREEWERICG